MPLNPDFDLGMSDWLSDSTGPAPKRLCLTLAHFPLRESNGRSSRFSKPVDSPEHVKAASGVVPANTEASMKWVVKEFHRVGS